MYDIFNHFKGKDKEHIENIYTKIRIFSKNKSFIHDISYNGTSNNSNSIEYTMLMNELQRIEEYMNSKNYVKEMRTFKEYLYDNKILNRHKRSRDEDTYINLLNPSKRTMINNSDTPSIISISDQFEKKLRLNILDKNIVPVNIKNAMNNNDNKNTNINNDNLIDIIIDKLSAL